jgi:RimJ/RimL family protein N-acetyltransferase
VPPTLADLDWPLHTERLAIRPSDVNDTEALFALRTRPEVAMWAHTVPMDVESWRERFRDPAIAPHMLTVELGGQVIGELMVRILDGGAQSEVRDAAAATVAELGWLIAPEHQRQGLATEAGRALLELCFGPLRLRRVMASTFEVNQPSWRVMEKLGMRLETRSRQDALHRDLGWIDGRVYALLAHELRTPRPEQGGPSPTAGDHPPLD